MYEQYAQEIHIGCTFVEHVVLAQNLSYENHLAVSLFGSASLFDAHALYFDPH
jgi:hypothetical protein